MAYFEFRLDLFGSTGPLEERVTAADLEEARNLAELRLLMSHDIRRVTVCRSGEELMNLRRERRLAPELAQDPGAARLRSIPWRGTAGATKHV